MKVCEILNVVRKIKFRDKWHKGIIAYAVEMLENICNGGHEEVNKDTVFSDLRLNHFTHNADGSKFNLIDRSKDAKEIVRRSCFGAVFLVSNEDICNRLYTKRDKANKHEYERAMDCQVTAVWDALEVISCVARGLDPKANI